METGTRSKNILTFKNKPVVVTVVGVGVGLIIVVLIVVVDELLLCSASVVGVSVFVEGVVIAMIGIVASIAVVVVTSVAIFTKVHVKLQ